MTDGFIQHYGADFFHIALSQPPAGIPPGPVHPGGSSPVDATMAAFGAATNLNLVEENTELAKDHLDRTGHAADAVRKFADNEADAVSKFQGVAAEAAPATAQQLPQDAMGGAMQGVNGAMQGITSALSGALGAVSKLPQGLMQAGQGALSPLMSAAQSLGKAGLGGATLASDIGPDPGLGGGDFGSGGGGGLGVGTTPASNLGPPPVPGTSTPTTPTSSLTNTGAAGPAGGSPAAGGSGGGMMPMAPGGAGAGAGGKGGKDDKVGEKRIAAPGVPNGQPVKGRTTAPPNVPVTKSVVKDAGHPGITPLKRIVGKDDSSK